MGGGGGGGGGGGRIPPFLNGVAFNVFWYLRHRMYPKQNSKQAKDVSTMVGS